MSETTLDHQMHQHALRYCLPQILSIYLRYTGLGQTLDIEKIKIRHTDLRVIYVSILINKQKVESKRKHQFSKELFFMRNLFF